MSVAAMTWVLKNSEAQLGARLVMIAIADEADAEGRNAWPSIARIAHHSRLSIRNVRRLLAKLEKSGELLIHPGTGRHGVHVYTLPGVSGTRPGGGSPIPAPPPAPDPGWRQKYTRKPASRGDAASSPIEPKPGHSRGDGASSPRGDNLAPLEALQNGPNGGDKSSRKGVTLCHLTQEQTRGKVRKDLVSSSSKSIDADNDKRGNSNSKTPRLFSILEINPDRIPRADVFAVTYLARAFQLEPPAAGAEALTEWLDAKVKWLSEQGLRYPKIILLRLKQLQRGEWTLPEDSIAGPPTTPTQEALRREI